jgi:hypothetical protein
LVFKKHSFRISSISFLHTFSLFLHQSTMICIFFKNKVVFGYSI